MEIFEVKNLTFRYPESNVDAVKNLSLTISNGEFVTLCGKSGCGKSTLLRHLKSTLTPHGDSDGEILFYGKHLKDCEFKEQSCKIGFVGQSPDNQIVTDKVWHELSFGLESMGLDNNTIRRRVAEIAVFFGIGAWFDSDVTELSGGQKQLLTLASVMVMQPEIIILDEPTAQLDPIAAEDFLTALKKINKEFGTTVFMSEHRLEEVFPLSDRIIVMEEGEIIADSAPRDIGDILNKAKSSMFSALPTSVRIKSALDCESNECPITVGEAKNWLKNYAVHHTPAPLPRKCSKPRDSEELIVLKDVWFRYRKNSPDVLKGMSVKLYKGELLAVIGGNGSGKSTLLSLIGGINKPYSGSIRQNDKKTAFLPQNPQSVFIKNSVIEDLYDALPKTSDREKIMNIAKLCDIEKLLNRHPYDLSGGEQQRAALAKILLTEPEILLLDEPTKGMDADFKRRFAAVLKRLIASGVTVLTVSHDIEFCARYADRCVLLFGGNAVAEGDPTAFFYDSSFYTTAATRIAKNIVPGAVTAEDIITAFGGKTEDEPEMPDPAGSDAPPEIPTAEKPRFSLWRKITAAFGVVLAAIATLGAAEVFNLPKLTEQEWLNPYLWFILPFLLLIIAFAERSDRKTSIRSEHRRSKRTITASAVILLTIPITILVGVYMLNDQKYLFISLLVMLECMIPFFLMFEGRRPESRELVTIAVLCAIAVAGRAAFYMLPQFKPVTAVTIITGVAFGGETGFLVGALSMLLSNIIFQQGPWTPWQMFAMGIIGFLAGILFKKGLINQSKGGICTFGFISALIIYGGITNPSILIISQTPITRASLISCYLAGLPMDTVHALATAFFLFLAAEPLLEKLNRIKIKYGLIE